MALRVADEVRRHLPGDRRIEPDGIVVVGFESLGDAHRQLLAFGAGAEVLDPPELRDRIRGTVGEMAALYG